jgi:hypothetical protein
MQIRSKHIHALEVSAEPNLRVLPHITRRPGVKEHMSYQTKWSPTTLWLPLIASFFGKSEWCYITVIHVQVRCSLLEYSHPAWFGDGALATVQFLAEYSTNSSIVIKYESHQIHGSVSLLYQCSWPSDFDAIEKISNPMWIRPFIGLQALQPPQIPGSQLLHPYYAHWQQV